MIKNGQQSIPIREAATQESDSEQQRPGSSKHIPLHTKFDPKSEYVGSSSINTTQSQVKLQKSNDKGSLMN